MDECDQIFNPSLNQQRYDFVIDLINQTESKVIIDVGCSECNFIERVKFKCPKVVELNGIDIDQSTLEFNLQKTKPLVCDGLFPRPEKLETKIYKGSIEEFDYRVGNECDLLSAIEVIEHLFPEQIPNFTKTIFELIKPKTVVLTTPNIEFNIIFKNGCRMKKFRHHDHKFEWTRSQFEHYCNSVIEKCDYTYRITGVGCATNKRYINVGFCSQIAIFTRKTTNSINNIQSEDIRLDYDHLFNYQLLSWEYFYTNDEKSNSEFNMKIELIDQLFNDSCNQKFICQICDESKDHINCSEFYRNNSTPILKESFPYFQLFIDFIRFHTLSQIYNHDNDPTKCCFVFRKKPTPIIINFDLNSMEDVSEEDQSSSSSYDDSSLHYTTMINPSNNDESEQYWD